MGLSTTCDKCGKRDLVSGDNYHLRHYYKGIRNYHEYDLCKSCNKKFEKWIKEDK
jgi:hypothetical protein